MLFYWELGIVYFVHLENKIWLSGTRNHKQKHGIVLGDLGEKLTLGNGDPIVGFRDVGYLGKKN